MIRVDHRHDDLQFALRGTPVHRFGQLEKTAAVVQTGQEVPVGRIARTSDDAQHIDVLIHPAVELLDTEGLVQVVARPSLEETRKRLGVGGIGYPDDGKLVLAMCLAHLRHHRQSVHARHVVIGDDQADVRIRLQDLQSLEAVSCAQGRIAVLAQQTAKIGAERTRIIDDQHPCAAVVCHPVDQSRDVIDADQAVFHHVVSNATGKHGLALGCVDIAGQHNDWNARALHQIDDLTIRRIGQIQVEHSDEEPVSTSAQKIPGLGEVARNDAGNVVECIDGSGEHRGDGTTVLDQQHLACSACGCLSLCRSIAGRRVHSSD